ncbi:MAG: ribonuclease III [Elusimicrobia bacterium]|nr:ribonuclease III [Elusimicrobiota bacterium]MBU2614948.1 ribonuclease III [Elusimicrobiota bacterium]
MTKLENLIGIEFQNKKLLDEAITHKSYAIETNKDYWNERLEFLGDSVLSCVIADYLFTIYPGSAEGHLSRIKSQFVSRQMLTMWAKELNLGEFILLSKGEETTGGRERESILSNALESLLGAIYLEKGFKTAKKFITAYFSEKKLTADFDLKSKLQEIIQAKYKILPVYTVIKESGPEHEKCFEIEVSVKKKVLGMGKGKSKKEAEQQAAKQALSFLSNRRAC